MKKTCLTFLTSLLSIVLFLISIYTTYGQVEKDTLSASKYYKKGDSLSLNRKFNESIQFFEKARLIYEKVQVWDKVASCYNKISENQCRNRKFEETFGSAKKALEISNTYLVKGNLHEANAYDNLGEYYEYMHKLDEALEYFQKALKIRKQLFPENHHYIERSYSNLARFYYIKAQYEKSLEYCKKVLAIILKASNPKEQKLDDIYRRISIIYSKLGQNNKGLSYARKSLDITIETYGENHIRTGKGYFNLSAKYYYMSQYDEALLYSQKALPILTEKNDLISQGKVHNLMGGAYFEKGEYNKALEYFKRSMEITMRLDNPHLNTIANSYHNRGNVYRVMKKYEKAFDFYDKALEVYKSISKGNYDNVANIYRSIGGGYLEKEEYEEALKYYQKSLTIYNNLLGKNSSVTSVLYLSIGDVYLKKKEYDEALVYYRKSLMILEGASDKKHNHIVNVYTNIGSVFHQQKEYTKAITFFDKALQSNLKKNNLKSTEGDFNPNHFLHLKNLLNTLNEKSKTLLALYRKNKSIANLKQSIDIYQNMDILSDQIRQSFFNYQDKLTFAQKIKEVCSSAIYAQLLLYKEEGDELALEKAFYYAEKSKANTLKELLSDAKAKSFLGLPNSLVSFEKTLKSDQSFYQSQIIKEQSKANINVSKLKGFENDLFEVNRREDSLIRSIEKNYPKYYQIKHKKEIISVSAIQQQLDDTTTMLEFVTTDSITYAFTISKDMIAVKELSISKLTERIDKFRKSIIDRDISVYKKQGNELYTTLIAPIKDKLIGNELIIVPDGSLWHLNFEILTRQKDKSNNPALLSYLIKDYAITYANSGNLLFNVFKNDQEIRKLEECLAFSFSDGKQIAENRAISLEALRGVGEDLPGTRKEIKAISKIIDGQYYYGSQAIEANFKNNASKYNILHLALHGSVDNEYPENSKLYFTKSKDTIEDNLLYSHELFSLDIPAELTVLSACNTGSGKIAKGEGIMSLGTAFQYAGTKSLLLTSWEVSDKTTPELMLLFYKNLKKGMSKSKALQQAKLQYLANANINRMDPFYWAGFYLVGDSTPIHFTNNTLLYWSIILGGMGILVFIVLWYRKKRS